MSAAPARAAGARVRHAASRRIAALVLRYLYLMRSSWPRLFELAYWPIVQLMMWGFLQTYLTREHGVLAGVGGLLIGSVLLWEVLTRGQLGFSMMFLEEMWSRNMPNLLISPLTRAEFLAALVIMSLIRLVISLVPMTGLALLFFGYDLSSLGPGLVAFFANLLLTAWSLAFLTSGIILRYGLGAEGLVWTMMSLIMPLCAVFYPVSVLPAVLQRLAWLLPPTYVFEGMRALVFTHEFRVDLMLWALAINLLLITAASIAFVLLLDSARRAGTLMSIGE